MDDLPVALLRTLVAVAESRSFSRAARLLGSSQPTVSAQVRRLEQLVGTTLIERTTRAVAPTAAARRLLPLARDMLRLQRIALERLDSQPLAGLVVIAVDESVALAHGLVDLVRGFNEAWPEVDLRVDFADPGTVLERFDAGLVDLALVHGASPASANRLAAIELGRDRIAWYGHARPTGEDPRWPLVGLPRGTPLRARTDEALLASATPHRIVVQADSLWLGIESARQGLGLIALPAPAARRHLLESAPGQGLPALGAVPVHLLQRDGPAAAAVALRNEIRQAWPARRGRTPGRSSPA
ncbi:MAG: LysR family transcriptional regulator [Burkholderiales bacterium]|nr:MAG: LysR family transcriptional regulator [Burkholderiales bacterium]